MMDWLVGLYCYHYVEGEIPIAKKTSFFFVVEKEEDVAGAIINSGVQTTGRKNQTHRNDYYLQ